jgi:Zn-finger nucleic acid-binding protein
MKCPHCFLELIIAPLYNKEVDKCPKCEGIWLDKNDSEYTFDFTDEGGDKDNMTYQDFQPKEDSNDENVDNKLEYYYYKKPFKENGKIDDMFDFE